MREAHCMLGLIANGASVGRFAGYKAAQVLLEGADVARVPAETLQRFSLLINMAAVQALAFYPPLTLVHVAEILKAKKR